MLRFLGQFQADFQLKSGWIEPLLVGGHAPFSPISSNNDFSILFPPVMTKRFMPYMHSKDPYGSWYPPRKSEINRVSM